MLNPQLIIGDAREALATLPSGSVRSCVTSPPYWGLRDYGVSGQMGLENTPEAYVAGMVAVFREVRRVLADDGTLFLNIGDSYAAGGNNSPHTGILKTQSHHQDDMVRSVARKVPIGLKPKDLVGIPWRLAFALQSDGWWLRQDIIWHKPNPMPESVTDRCTKAHEYIFLLTKSARYYWDQDAVSDDAIHAGKSVSLGDKSLGRRAGADWGNASADAVTVAAKRNPRSVWTITTKPCSEAHFATFPPELPERCIRAGTAPGDTVLDPFTGAGTTGMVAIGLGRNFVGCELNPAYAKIAERRINDVNPMFVPPIVVRTLAESPTPLPMVGSGIDP